MSREEIDTNNQVINVKYIDLIKRILNGALFYIGWLICMHQAPGNYPYIGPLVVAAILGYNLVMTHMKIVDLILIAVLALVGTIVDTIYIQAGMITYKGGYASFPNIAPLWITSLWALYAISINHSLVWLNYNMTLAALMGAGGAISSYLVGIKLEGAEFLWPEYTSLAVIGVVWAVVVPLSLKFSSWLKRFA